MRVRGYAPGTPCWAELVSADPAGPAAAGGGAGGAGRVPRASVRALGTAATVADAGGALFGTWLRSRFVGAQVSFEPCAICWYELATHDLERAGAFYKEVFG